MTDERAAIAEEEGIFTGIPVPIVVGGANASGIPTSAIGRGNNSRLGDIFTALPLTTNTNNIRRRRATTPTSNTLTVVADVLDLLHHVQEEEEEENDENDDDNNRLRCIVNTSSTTKRLVVVESICLFILFCVLCFSDWRIQVPFSAPKRWLHSGGSTQQQQQQQVVESKEFETLLNQNNYTLVYFDAPQQKQHSSSATLPARIANILGGRYDDLAIAHVDCEKTPDICQAQIILACPTVRLYSRDWSGNLMVVETDEVRQSSLDVVFDMIEGEPSLPLEESSTSTTESSSSSTVQQEVSTDQRRRQVLQQQKGHQPLPTLVQSNFSQVLAKEESAIVIFADEEVVNKPPYKDDDPSKKPQQDWWNRVFEDQAGMLKRRGYEKTKIFLAAGSPTTTKDWGLQHESTSTLKLFRYGAPLSEVDYPLEKHFLS